MDPRTSSSIVVVVIVRLAVALIQSDLKQCLVFVRKQVHVLEQQLQQSQELSRMLPAASSTPQASQQESQQQAEQYVTKTINYINTVKDFCDRETGWTYKRESEIEDMRDIRRRTKECCACLKMKKLKNDLKDVLEGTLEGLEELRHFLDAVESLAVTSLTVFMNKSVLPRGENTEAVRSVISAKTVSLLLIQFRTDDEAFFKPELDNVDLLVYQLNKYICITKWLCKTMRMDKSFRLTFLVDAQEFIRTYETCHSKVSRSLSGLEKNAVGLDRMKVEYSVLTIIGCLLGIVGGILSFAGVVLASLAFTRLGGLLGFMSGAFSLCTGVIDFAVQRFYVREAEKNISDFMEERQKIVDCLKQVASHQYPTPHLEAGNMELGLMKVLNYFRTMVKSFDTFMDAASVLDPLDFSKLATYVSVGVNLITLGGDLPCFCRESWDILKRKKSKAARRLRTNIALWRSEMEAWKKIHDSLFGGMQVFQEKMDVLQIEVEL
ncbi:hypothetical protein NFI96_001894 [Prochilodus magdalenae]|nr:hypothetical protein NFI96_001894 [Prochilodus magdalenae]